MALVTTILLLGMGMFWSQAEAFMCVETLARGYHQLTENVTCPDDAIAGPALTLEGGGYLNLNGHALKCSGGERNGIVLDGRNAKVLNGSITKCSNGVVITGEGHHKVLQLSVENKTREGIKVVSAYNQVINSQARNNEKRGFKIEGDYNYLNNCLAKNNVQKGFQIEGGDNKIINSAAFDNCRYGIEIEGGGIGNFLIHNYVSDNGNLYTCEYFGEDYRPWFYAEIDIKDGAKNIVINNRTSGNQGCYVENCDQNCNSQEEDCERNLWNENVDENGTCDSTNRWINNRVDGERAEPECGLP